jgi:hypothetical protein
MIQLMPTWGSDSVAYARSEQDVRTTKEVLRMLLFSFFDRGFGPELTTPVCDAIKLLDKLDTHLKALQAIEVAN